MKVADLYVRVSTDELADKGYSQRNQEEVLRRYCDLNGIVINSVVYEDHSAKSFNRPAWSKLLAEIRKKKNKSLLVLFTKWDRFSRNAGDAYQMINLLRSFGAEPQAIEQPLDLSIPENKMMLAIYLAAPEVENDRRALNILHGMRRARKEGRYMCKAPIGYINKSTESGKKYIAPYEPAASIMVWVFEELAKGQYAVEAIWKESLKKGLQIKRNPFWYAIRNPVYCGKILVSNYKDEKAFHATGLHQPLITESLFYEVQDVLDGKKKTYRAHLAELDIFQLRGFLLCPRCGKLLTASASKGRTIRYHYYHCTSQCGTRFKSENANELFGGLLRTYVPRPAAIETYAKVITSYYTTLYKNSKNDVSGIRKELENVNTRLSKARDLLLNSDIEPEEYKDIKKDCDRRLQLLEAKLIENSTSTPLNIVPLLQQAIKGLSHLDEVYFNGDIRRKRQVIGSMFPEKLVFDGFTYRTARLNSAVELIYRLGKGLTENKKGENSAETEISCCVDLYGFEP